MKRLRLRLRLRRWCPSGTRRVAYKSIFNAFGESFATDEHGQFGWPVAGYRQPVKDIHWRGLIYQALSQAIHMLGLMNQTPTEHGVFFPVIAEGVNKMSEGHPFTNHHSTNHPGGKEMNRKMKRSLILMIALVFMMLPGFSYARQEHREVGEKAGAAGWQVPLFAVDRAGNPVENLQKADLQLMVNEQIIDSFKLIKGAMATPAGPAAPNENLVVLLFDTAMSSKESTETAQEIAAGMVKAFPPHTRFVLMAIIPFKGLTIFGEEIQDPNRLAEMIREAIKPQRKRAFKSTAEIGTVQVPDAYTAEKKMGELMSTAAAYFQRDTLSFIDAFKTLYLFLNSHREKKSIYFFSEGVYDSIKKYIPEGTAMYHHYLSGIARDMQHCGAVLFIINPAPGLVGEATLQLIANDSGGTYLEGEPQEMTRKIKKMYRAYYEISLPALPGPGQYAYTLALSNRREGIIFYTPQVLERPRPYSVLDDKEKELLVMHLMTQPSYSFLQQKISAYNLKIANTKKSKDKVTYTVVIPENYLNRPLDFYIHWTPDESEVSPLKKGSVALREKFQVIEFPLTQAEIGVEDAPRHGYLVLVDRAMNTARVLGKENYPEDPEIREVGKITQKEILAQVIVSGETMPRPQSEEVMETEVAKGAAAGRTGEADRQRELTAPEKEITLPANITEPLKAILQGAANYCEKLTRSTFQYECREKVLVDRRPLTDAEDYQPTITSSDAENGTYDQLDEIRTKAYTQVRSYELAYRLSKQGQQISEERNLLSSKDKETVKPEQVIRADAYFTERLVLVPLRYLDRSRWARYNFRLVGDEKWKGRSAVVVEVEPAEPGKVTTIYGKLWIDKEDFTLLKIEAEPRSIPGYAPLAQLAEKLKTKLYLSLETEFAEIHDGIRYPTRVHILEKYQGGDIIREHRGAKGWDRNRTTFTYMDYRYPGDEGK